MSLYYFFQPHVNLHYLKIKRLFENVRVTDNRKGGEQKAS